MEPVSPERRGELGMKYLERDLSLILLVFREIHGRHPAFTKRAFDLIAVFQRCLEVFEILAHNVSD